MREKEKFEGQVGNKIKMTPLSNLETKCFRRGNRLSYIFQQNNHQKQLSKKDLNKHAN